MKPAVTVLAGAHTQASLDSQGFAPFAEVITGIETVEQINAEYGGEPEVPMIINYGSRYLHQNFPNLTTITTCLFEPVPFERLATASLQRLAFSKCLLNSLDATWTISETLLKNIVKFSMNAAIQSVVDRQLDQPYTILTPATDTASHIDATKGYSSSIGADNRRRQLAQEKQEQSHPLAEGDPAELEDQLGELDELTIPAEALLDDLSALDIPSTS